MSNRDLSQLPCTLLKGVGARLAERLARCDIHTIQDLLFHLPYRYQDRTQITPIAYTQPGEWYVIEAEIQKILPAQGRRNSFVCHLQDSSGIMMLRFFHLHPKQKENFKLGQRLRCFGEMKQWQGQYEMIHPECQWLSVDAPAPVEERLTPVYSSTEGLTQRMLRKLTDSALTFLNSKHNLPDYLPQQLVAEMQLPTLHEALRYLHRPSADADINELLQGTHPAQQRLALEELLAHHLSLRQIRQAMQLHQAPAFTAPATLADRLMRTLPFDLTHAQQRVLTEITQDMQQSKPMLRLLQGDVGSGKTVIAAFAMLQALQNGYQAALMAPTELLAEQHLQTFRSWLEPLQINIAWLTGSLKGKARQANLTAVAEGAAQVVIGTHALFQQEVHFKQLGLVVIDEQHRFGVHQRLALREKGIRDALYPHQLIMTATPIPRTLAMLAYADLDNSILDELPPGRIPVQTLVISNKRREEVIARIQQACQSGQQVYWVCPLIEESEQLQCQAAETTAQQLMQLLPHIKIGLIHGRMSAAQKETVMHSFKQNETQLLVATTVIEVGVNVPNASLMVIENAERLGLAQLHQLRGRVGRGNKASFCILLYQADRLSQLAKQRLAAMRETNDGFVIAKRDLELRGPGELFGTRQAGLIQLRVADLIRDQILLDKVHASAEVLLQNHPEAITPLIRRWIPQPLRYAAA